MNYTQLGRTGLLVSEVCLGTMNFGRRMDEADSHECMNKALELGINFFDTADVYGLDATPPKRGLTEEMIGNWFAQDATRREEVVLATKCWNAMTTNEGVNNRGVSARHIKLACEASLKRLKTDTIDVYIMHHIERTTPFDEIWQAMEQLVREGKILYVGSSNFPAWQIVKANELAKQRHFLGLVCEQSPFNLTERMLEMEVMPACKDYGVGVMAYGSIGGGMLAGGVIERAEKKMGRSGMSPRFIKKVEANKDAIIAYENLCKEIGEHPLEVAMSWMAAHQGVCTSVVGPSAVSQLDQYVRGAELRLDAEVFEKLDQLWPGPGGEAPEAYSWGKKVLPQFSYNNNE